MKNKTKEILFHLKKAVRTTEEMLHFLPTYREMRRQVFGSMRIPHFNYEEWKWKEEQKFYALLSVLRKQGLVDKRKVNKKSLWSVTSKGLERLKVINGRKNSDLPIKSYTKKPSADWNLVIFDIPEKQRAKRVWLRKQLRLLGFKMLQKSVWIGKYGLSDDFIFDLRRLGILQYLHILKIRKSGSLTDLLR